MSQPMRGVYTIPSTPFDEHEQIDEQALRRIVDFCVACGAHGLVYPVNASGFTTLSDDERVRASRIVVEQCAGRIPAVIGVAGICKEHAAMFAREARAMRADAVIAMTPYLNKLQDEQLFVEYYQAISDAAGMPVFIQNHDAPVGTNMPADLLLGLCREIEHVKYVKEETTQAR